MSAVRPEKDMWNKFFTQTDSMYTVREKEEFQAGQEGFFDLPGWKHFSQLSVSWNCKKGESKGGRGGGGGVILYYPTCFEWVVTGMH